MAEADQNTIDRRLFDLALAAGAVGTRVAVLRLVLDGACALLGARLGVAAELLGMRPDRVPTMAAGDLDATGTEAVTDFALRLLAGANPGDRPLRFSRGELAKTAATADLALPSLGGCLLLRFGSDPGGRGGLIALFDKRGREFDANDEQTLLDIAGVARVALARTRLLEEAKADNEHLRSALDGTDEGLWDWDIAGGKMYHSPRYAVITGYEPGEREPNYDRWISAIHSDDRAATMRAFGAMLSGGAAGFAAQYRIRAKSGEWVWVLDRGKVVERDDAGRPLRAVGTLTDITARRLDEQRYRYALEASNDGMWDWSIRSDRSYRSARYHEILGYAPGELPDTYETWESAIHPDERDEVLDALGRHMRGENEFYEAEYRIRSKSGAWVWVHERAKVVERDAEGQPLRVVGAQTDVTARRQAEEQLRAQGERLRAALSASMTGTYRWDIRTDRLVDDESMGRLIGRSGPVLENALSDFYDRVHPDDRERVIMLTEQCLKNREDVKMDYRIVLPDGTVRWIAESGKLFLDAAGDPLYMTGACTDITDRKQVEEELARSRDRAEAANRAKSEFLANMSHELRTPLNAVIGFSDAMLGGYAGTLTPKQREYAADIKASGEHLLEIVNDVLDLSKIEAGKLELFFEELDLAAVVSVCVGLMQPRADAAGLRLVVELPDTKVTVWADDLRLRQILLNVLSNAVKFTPAGGRVTIGAEITDQAVRISVADTGIGMRQQEVALALEPFRQVDGSLARRYEGTGLGLPLVKTLTEMHGGTLEIATNLGAGTTVTVSLPLRRPRHQGKAA